MWWVAMLSSSAICVAAGMWGCRYRELQPVFFGGGRILGSNATPSAAAAGRGPDDDDDDDDGHEGPVDEEMGLAQGRGKQRGREEYEMGKMPSPR